MAKTHKLYNEKRINLITLDLVENDIPDNYKGADYCILMFVLSAIKPENHEKVIKKIYDSLNKDGILYFRDYALYDMAQMRFALKKKNKISENFYRRSDNTFAYYFSSEEVNNIFKKNGFEVLENKVICRLIENKKDNKKMHRLWLQAKLKKI